MQDFFYFRIFETISQFKVAFSISFFVVEFFQWHEKMPLELFLLSIKEKPNQYPQIRRLKCLSFKENSVQKYRADTHQSIRKHRPVGRGICRPNCCAFFLWLCIFLAVNPAGYSLSTRVTAAKISFHCKFKLQIFFFFDIKSVMWYWNEWYLRRFVLICQASSEISPVVSNSNRILILKKNPTFNVEFKITILYSFPPALREFIKSDY